MQRMLTTLLLLSAAAISLAQQEVSTTPDTATAVAEAPIIPDVVRRSGDTIIVNTTTLTPDVKGFRDVTPVEVYFAGGKVRRVVLQPNHEGRRFIAAIQEQGLLDIWNGLTPQEALARQADAVTGATYSSNGIIQNVRAALQYYEDNGLESPAAGDRSTSQLLLVLGVVMLVLGITMGIYRKHKRSSN